MKKIIATNKIKTPNIKKKTPQWNSKKVILALLALTTPHASAQRKGITVFDPVLLGNETSAFCNGWATNINGNTVIVTDEHCKKANQLIREEYGEIVFDKVFPLKAYKGNIGTLMFNTEIDINYQPSDNFLGSVNRLAPKTVFTIQQKVCDAYNPLVTTQLNPKEWGKALKVRQLKPNQNNEWEVLQNVKESDKTEGQKNIRYFFQIKPPKGKRNVCPGDSGSPFFKKTKTGMKVIGVLYGYEGLIGHGTLYYVIKVRAIKGGPLIRLPKKPISYERQESAL